MTDISSFTPTDVTTTGDGAAKTAAEKTKRAKEAALDAVKAARETASEVAQQTRSFAAEKARVGAAWTSEKAKEARHVAEEHPMGVALGAFVIGMSVGFLISRNRH